MNVNITLWKSPPKYMFNFDYDTKNSKKQSLREHVQYLSRELKKKNKPNIILP